MNIFIQNSLKFSWLTLSLPRPQMAFSWVNARKLSPAFSASNTNLQLQSFQLLYFCQIIRFCGFSGQLLRHFLNWYLVTLKSCKIIPGYGERCLSLMHILTNAVGHDAAQKYCGNIRIFWSKSYLQKVTIKHI